MMERLVSIVIPFYNGKSWLTEAVESVISQTYSNKEIIVINDGSPEDLSEFIEKYNKKITYISQQNKGAAAARNLGIEISKGEYIAFLDADDVWMPNKLEIQISYMLENKAYWSHTNYSTFGLDKKEKIVDVSSFRGETFPLSIISNPIATPSVIVKASVFRENSFRFDEDMKYGEDTILWLLLSNKYPLLVVNEILVKIRMRGSNAGIRAYSQIKGRADIWKTIITKKIFNNIYHRLSIPTRFAYNYCSVLYKCLNLLETTRLNKRIEIISKILYILPWTIFKVEKYIILIRSR